MARIQINQILYGKKSEYKVLEWIGGGGMAMVYRVEDRQSPGTYWALKVLHPFASEAQELAEALRMFEQEAEILWELNHANLPKVKDYFDHTSRSCLVMEFIEGKSLQDHLEEVKAALPETDVLGWMVQICKVLDYLHNPPQKDGKQKKPIIFRDLKPSNIMLTTDGVIKLIDFGIARTYKGNKARDTITMGSANYAPLEQWGRGETDPRSDIYGLGATMYHLLTNDLPPLASEPYLTPPSHLNPAISPATEDIILKAMEGQQNKRYQSAKEMQGALEACLKSLGVVAPPPQAPPKAFCPNCGYANRSKARFCSNCGNNLAGELKGILELSNSGDKLSLDNLPFLMGRGRVQEGQTVNLDLSVYDRRYVSRRHAEISRQEGQFIITDLDSSNGTLLNGNRLTPHEPELLRSGDIIKIGQVHLEFKLIR